MEPRVLVIVVGGNVSLYAKPNRHNVWTLDPATLNEIKKTVMGGSTDQLVLREGDVKGNSVRVDFEELDAGRRQRLVSRELKDSSAINPALWEKLARLIYDNRGIYDGFAVLHGLDTMAYTASALSFMLRNLNCPVIFTGSQLPLNYTRSDAPQNIICAITLAAARTSGEDSLPIVPEVCIFCGDTLLRANRTRMTDPSSYKAFASSNYPQLVQVGEYIHVNQGMILRHPSARMTLQPAASAPVHILDIYPGVGGKTILNIFHDELAGERRKIDELRDKPIGGLLLRTYGMGTAPTLPSFLEAISTVVSQGVVVLNVTQAHAGHLSLPQDPVSLRLFEHGVIYGADMTAEAAYAKLCVLLSEGHAIARVKEELQSCLAGEQSRSLVFLRYSQTKGRTKKVAEEDIEFTQLLRPSVTEQWLLPRKNLVRQIQLRVFGLEPPSGSQNAEFDIFVVDRFDDRNKIECELMKETLRWDPVDAPDGGMKTINKVTDISHQRRFVSSPDTILKIASDAEIKWSHIEIVFYIDSYNLEGP